MQGKTPIFAVTAIFVTIFLVNMQKIQKYHFFLEPDYIIIRGERLPPEGLQRRAGAETRPQTPLKTKMPRTVLLYKAGLCLKFPETASEMREIRDTRQPQGCKVVRKVRIRWLIKCE